MATALQNANAALEPLRRFPIGPMNGDQMKQVAACVSGAIAAALAGDTVDEPPLEREEHNAAQLVAGHSEPQFVENPAGETVQEQLEARDGVVEPNLFA